MSISATASGSWSHPPAGVKVLFPELLESVISHILVSKEIDDRVPEDRHTRLGGLSKT